MKTIDVKNKWGVIKATIMVDDEDYEMVSKLRLYAHTGGNRSNIKVNTGGNRINIKVNNFKRAPFSLMKIFNPHCKRSYFKNGNQFDFTRSNILSHSIPHVKVRAAAVFKIRKSEYGFVGAVNLRTPTFKTYAECYEYAKIANRIAEKAREELTALHINYASSPF